MIAVSGRKTRQRSKLPRGFTLVELFITIAVAAILAMVALPSMRELMLNNHVTATTNELIHDVNLARSEATSRGTLVAVISTSDSNDWSSGWKVVADDAFAADGTFVDAKDTVLHVNTGVSTDSNYKVTTKVTTTAGTGITPSDNLIIFNAQGNLIPLAQSFSINVCRPDSKPAKSRWITVAAAGGVSSQVNTSSSPAPGC